MDESYWSIKADADWLTNSNSGFYRGKNAQNIEKNFHLKKMSSKRARTFDLNDILAQTVKTAQERNKDNLEKRNRVSKTGTEQ